MRSQGLPRDQSALYIDRYTFQGHETTILIMGHCNVKKKMLNQDNLGDTNFI